jgi:myo-inositol-1-phosphate synthase
MAGLEVSSPNVRYSDAYIESQYKYQATNVVMQNGKLVASPTETLYTFRTGRHVPKVGCMMVGWGGNNGTTLTAAVLANKLGLSWRTKDGVQQANYFGSITQASTVYLGSGPDGDVYVPFKDLLPMVNPNDMLFDGKI